MKSDSTKSGCGVFFLIAIIYVFIKAHLALIGGVMVFFAILVALFLGYIYLYKVRPDDAKRAREREEQAQERADYVAETTRLNKLKQYKQLLDNGTLTQAEFDDLKHKVLSEANKVEF